MGVAYALISIPIAIFSYIAIIRFLFELIGSEYDNTDHGYTIYMTQGENRVVRNEINDNKQYHNPSEYENAGKIYFNTKDRVLLIVIIIAIVVLILSLSGIF